MDKESKEYKDIIESIEEVVKDPELVVSSTSFITFEHIDKLIQKVGCDNFGWEDIREWEGLPEWFKNKYKKYL